MSTRTAADQRYIEGLIQEASKSWPLLTNTNHSRGKVKCPECGAGGWPGGSWTHAHTDHTECECGKIVTQRGLANHRNSHRRRR